MKPSETKALIAILTALSCATLVVRAAQNTQDSTQPISSRLAFLRAQRAAAASRLQPRSESGPKTESSSPTNSSGAPVAAEPPKSQVSSGEAAAPILRGIASATLIQEPTRTTQTKPSLQTAQASSGQTNRNVRTADIFQNGDGFNIFVTNTCERELMHVNIKTSRPFYGVIHTRNQRQKEQCTVEGTGDTEYNLDISHVLNQQDPAYCGVIKARRESPDDRDLLSVVIAVRVHRNIELSDDKFFLLNCTNRCRRADCSSPSARLASDDSRSGRLFDDELGEREGERETSNGAARRPGEAKETEDECTVWKFPWLITLLWCMGILLLAMIISHCIMCSSLVCRCVKTEVEEREPSVYEGATDLDDEDSLYSKKTHPMRIDYDNRNVYKTSNNYEPYSLENDDQECDEEEKNERKRNKSASSNKRRHRSNK